MTDTSRGNLGGVATADELREQFKAIPDTRSEKNQPFSIRMWRGISWLQSAEQAGQVDVRFICLWIAFNAAYGHEDDPGRDAGDRRSWQSFLARLHQLDRHDAIGQILRDGQSDVLNLVDQKFLYRPFWQEADGWEERQTKRRRASLTNYGKGYTLPILQELFESLYTLRIQVFHGAATSGSHFNRDNLARAVRLLEQFVPAMLQIMLDAGPGEDWGDVCFPPVEE